MEDKQDKNIMAMNVTSKNKYNQGSFTQLPLQTSHLIKEEEDLTITEAEAIKKYKKNNERYKAFCILDVYGCPMARCDRQESHSSTQPNS